MKPAAYAPDEKQRLEELDRYGILDTAAEKDYDNLIELAAFICKCAGALITFVGKDRQWFKARRNCAASETTRDISLCAHAILQDEVFEVQDISKDPRFKDCPTTINDKKIRFYAGAPIRSSRGFKLGTICVIDSKPHELTEGQKDALKKLSGQVSRLLELGMLNNRIRKRSENLLKNEESFKKFFDQAPTAQWIQHAHTHRFIAVNRAAQKLFGYTLRDFRKMKVDDLLPDYASLLAMRLANTGDKPEAAIHTYTKKDGSQLVLEITSSTINYDATPVIIATLTDLTEKRDLQEKLQLEKISAREKIEHAALNAQAQERQFLGQELHDNINQMLAGTKLFLELAYSNESMRLDLIQRSRETISETIREIRTLSKYLVDSSEKSFDLVQAIETLLQPYKVAQLFDIHFIHSGDLDQITTSVKVSLVRIIQEQLNNVTKHAGSKNLWIILTGGSELKLEIRDDGKGFEQDIKRNGIGLRNISERAAAMKGVIDIETAPGKGATIRITVPGPWE